LDKAMIVDNNNDASSKTRNPWRLCSVNQVEEVKLVLCLIPIGFSCLMFNVVQAQLHTYFIKQGSTMLRSIGPHFQLPPASLQAFTCIIILITVPLYERIFVSIAKKFTRHPSSITVLQRIGVGLFLSIINMVVGLVAALVEAKRVSIAKDNNLIFNPKAVVMFKSLLISKFKLIENDRFNHLINIVTLPITCELVLSLNEGCPTREIF